MAVNRSVRLRRWSLALGTSIAAMGFASTAQAQCSPDPTVANGTTTCTGTDTDGLVVASSGTRVIVATSATVLANTPPPPVFGMFDNTAAILTSGQNTRILIGGRVDGGSTPGVLTTAYFTPSS